MKRKFFLDGVDGPDATRFACRELGFGQPVAKRPTVATALLTARDLVGALGKRFWRLMAEVLDDEEEDEPVLVEMIHWGGARLSTLVEERPRLAGEVLVTFLAFEVLEVAFGPYSENYEYYLNRLVGVEFVGDDVRVVAEAYPRTG